MMNRSSRPAHRYGRAGIAALGLGAVATVIAVAVGLLVEAQPAIASVPSSVGSALAASLPGMLQADVDVSKVAGAAACGECHAAAMEAWKKSTHSITFATMHKKPRAKEIADKLGLKGGIKRNPLCLNCHYTSQMDGGKVKPMSGVSCESCHGAAQDWISPQLHHENANKAGSEPERQQILKSCEEAGMLRPANVYRVAQNCYSCHTVPNEELVNVGGHHAGSAFELVSWSQGEVRHNYQYSDDKSNRSASAERKRVLFVVGTMTDLEYSLRALGKATDKSGDYYKAMKKRVVSAFKRAHGVVKLVDVPGLEAALPAYDNAVIKELVGNTSAATAAADKLSSAISAFAASSDGSSLAALDAKIPGPGKYHGKAQP